MRFFLLNFLLFFAFSGIAFSGWFNDSKPREKIPSNVPVNIACNDVRIDSPGGAMEHVSVRSQGDLPICYAEAAAQCVDAWRFSHGDKNFKHQTSALVAAINHDLARDRLELENGGSTMIAIDIMKDYGSCNKDVVLDGLDRYTLDAVVKSLKLFRDQSKELNSNKNMPNYLAFEKANRLALEQYYTAPYCLEARSVLPDLDTVLNFFKQAKQKGIFKNILAYSCSGNNVRDLHDLPEFDDHKLSGSTLDTMKALASSLKNSKSQPQAVAFCDQLITHDPDYIGINTDGNIIDEKKCEAHSVLLIGKRQNPQNGRCEFLIRNSWGTSCGNMLDNWKCENGNFWIDAEAMSLNAYKVSSFTE